MGPYFLTTFMSSEKNREGSDFTKWAQEGH